LTTHLKTFSIFSFKRLPPTLEIHLLATEYMHVHVEFLTFLSDPVGSSVTHFLGHHSMHGSWNVSFIKNSEIVFHKGLVYSQRLDEQDLSEGLSKPSGIRH
jgi:hypothetical protein